jgi:outer membrane protein OmpA-like peptidoglycan-associated protein
MKFNKPTIALLGLAIVASSALSAQGFKKVYSNPVHLGKAINSDKHEESLPILSADGESLYFVRTYTEDEGELVKGDQDVYVSVKENGKYSLASMDLPTINDKHNNAVIGMSADGNNLYLLNQYAGGRRFSNKGISMATKTGDGTWGEATAITMPSTNFKGDHYGGFISADEKTIIFTAELEGSIGKEDLYYTEINEDGNWSEIKSLGNMVNSTSADFAPFLSADGKLLFFSSFGHNGKGSADIFVSERVGKGMDEWTKPEPLEGINSKGFEAYPNIDKNNNIIFASNNGGKGYADLYSTTMRLEKIQPKPVEPVKSEEEKAIEKLNSEFDLQLIYFDYNKSDVKVEDAIILDAVMDVLNKFPKLKIVLSGHTDERGREAYNMKLSNKRVNAGKDYLVKRGIDKKRIFTQAFGETELKIKNAKTEEEHVKNRRVEIEVLGSM